MPPSLHRNPRRGRARRRSEETKMGTVGSGRRRVDYDLELTHTHTLASHPVYQHGRTVNVPVQVQVQGNVEALLSREQQGFQSYSPAVSQRIPRVQTVLDVCAKVNSQSHAFVFCITSFSTITHTHTHVATKPNPFHFISTLPLHLPLPKSHPTILYGTISAIPS